MHIPSLEDGFAASRFASLTLIGLLLVSAVGGVVVSSGIAAAQVNESAGNATARTPTASGAAGGNSPMPNEPVNTTIAEFKRENLGYKQLSSEDKREFRGILQRIAETDSKQGRLALVNEIEKTINWPNTRGSTNRREIVRANFGIGTDPASTPDDPVNATITKFKQQNLGYKQLSPGEKRTVRNNLQKLANTGVRNSEQISKKQQAILSDIGRVFGTDGNYAKREQIIKKTFGFGTNVNGKGYSAAGPKLPDINIPSLIDVKLKSIADAFKEAASNVLKKVYNLAFTTPVPENDGWLGVFGTPTNEPFQQLHQQLLVEKLYPVTNYLLSIGVMVLGLSLMVNPLMSRFRILDLFIKFVAFLALYVFAWGLATLMHGVVNDITLWIRPSPAEMSALVTNADKMGAATIGAYFFGSGGILSTVFGLGVELGLRRVALEYFFPYVFPVLLLVLYLSPWQRLSSYASMGIWQYVNVLTMVIPMAILLKAAAIVEFSPGDGAGAMLVLIALFLFALSMPIISTYFFIQVSGKVAGHVRTAAAGAASRVGAAKDKLGWGAESSSDTTATAGTTPGERAEDAVEANASANNSVIPSSGELSKTTAADVRALEEEKQRDPMNPAAMKQAYFEDNPQRTTTQQKPAD